MVSIDYRSLAKEEESKTRVMELAKTWDEEETKLEKERPEGPLLEGQGSHGGPPRSQGALSAWFPQVSEWVRPPDPQP